MKHLTIRKKIIDRCNWLSENGYFGSRLSAGGNVSGRLDDPAGLAITPSGVAYGELTPEDICLVDFDGGRIDYRLPPSIETGMHAAIYQARGDVNAVVHTHQPWASVFALIGRSIPALFDEVALAIGERVALVPYARSGSGELADQVRRSVDNGCHCFVMQNHGALSLGSTLDAACQNAELLEKSAQAYQRALATGQSVTTLPSETLAWVRKLRA